jgi:hypothetical protein
MTTPVLLDERDTEKMGVVITLKRNLLISADAYQHIATCEDCISQFANITLHARHKTEEKKGLVLPFKVKKKHHPFKEIEKRKSKSKQPKIVKGKKKVSSINIQPLGSSTLEDKKWLKSRADTLGLDKKGSIAFALKNTNWSYRHIAGILNTNTNRIWEINSKDKIRKT